MLTAMGDPATLCEDIATQLQGVCHLLVHSVLTSGGYREGDRVEEMGRIHLDEAVGAAVVCYGCTWEKFLAEAWRFSSWQAVVVEEQSLEQMEVSDKIDCMKGYGACMEAVWGTVTMGTQLGRTLSMGLADYEKQDPGCSSYVGGANGIVNGIISWGAARTLAWIRDEFKGAACRPVTFASQLQPGVISFTAKFKIDMYSQRLSYLKHINASGIPRPTCAKTGNACALVRQMNGLDSARAAPQESKRAETKHKLSRCKALHHM